MAAPSGDRSVVVSVGNGTAGVKASVTGRGTGPWVCPCGSSRKTGFSRLILTVHSCVEV